MRDEGGGRVRGGAVSVADEAWTGKSGGGALPQPVSGECRAFLSTVAQSCRGLPDQSEGGHVRLVRPVPVANDFEFRVEGQPAAVTGSGTAIVIGSPLRHALSAGMSLPPDRRCVPVSSRRTGAAPSLAFPCGPVRRGHAQPEPAFCVCSGPSAAKSRASAARSVPSVPLRGTGSRGIPRVAF